ncbi:hypothetical protein SS50377_21120 [Spironucleus salmonicida]|uniref:Uncharacterized protein n=1 Tax=Spironucleus salmonicida TaxID=348837 RepID=V6LJK9_9EUKA|nr:hypothetical protein SS50377_21120 [Spironucleus salmonicida]|eukprot:EST43901.1 Hypothetical protein SS50377_16201 [Spironucleus salmonicida]
MSKPTQYFLDKSEAIALKNTLQKHILDANIAYKQAKTQSFVSKTLQNLTPDVAVSNPYESTIINSEMEYSMQKLRKNQNLAQLQEVPIEIQQADAYIQKHSRAFNIVDNFSRKLGLESPKINLGEVQIAQKREAININGKIELKPTVFELPKTQNFVYSKDPNAYVRDQEDQLDLLDNRIPLRVVQVQEYQEAVKQKSLEKSKKVIETQGTRKTTIVTHKNYKQDHLDFAVNSTFLDKTSERMLKNVQKISNHQYFVDGKCRCACHKDENPSRRICDICLCKLQKDDSIELEVAQQVQSNNLLKNTNLPLYVSKTYNQNILNIDGRLTNNQVINLIHHQQSQMNPDEKILFIAKQQEFLADKTWSPKLRSDIAPKQKPQELEVKIQNAHLLSTDSALFNVDQMSLQGNIDMANKNMLEASKVLVTENINNIHQERRNLRSEEEVLRKKIQRVVDNKQILESRKTELSGVFKIVNESILKASQSPQEPYKHYIPPILRTIDNSQSLKIQDLNKKKQIKANYLKAGKRQEQYADLYQTPQIELQREDDNQQDFSGYQSMNFDDQIIIQSNGSLSQNQQQSSVSNSAHTSCQPSFVEQQFSSEQNDSIFLDSSTHQSQNMELDDTSTRPEQSQSVQETQKQEQSQSIRSSKQDTDLDSQQGNTNSEYESGYDTGYGSGYDSGYGSKTGYQSGPEHSQFSQNFSDATPQVKQNNQKLVPQKNSELPPYIPSNRADSPLKKGPKPKYMQPRTIDRVSKTKHDEVIDIKKLKEQEKFKLLVADPTLPQLTQKQFQKALSKAYTRLDNLNEYVELNIIYGDDKVNFNDYTNLRHKHVKSSMK